MQRNSDFYSLRDAIEFLSYTYLGNNIENYMEIGVHRGVSLRAMTRLFPDMKRVVVCDNWAYYKGETGSTEGARESIEAVFEATATTPLFPLERVTFLEGNSLETVPKYLAEHPNLHFDIVFVDGAHGAKACYQDVLNVYKRADVVVVHDTVLHGYLTEVIIGLYRLFLNKEFWLVMAEFDPHGTVMLIRRPTDD